MEGLKYTKEHEWIKLEGDIGIVGVTNFAQEQLTDVVFVELPEKKVVEAGKPMGVIESVKSVSDIFAPVNGEIIEVNESLSDNPELINKAPYGEGWIAKIKVANPADVDSLLSEEDWLDIEPSSISIKPGETKKIEIISTPSEFTPKGDYQTDLQIKVKNTNVVYHDSLEIKLVAMNIFDRLYL